MKKKTQAEQIIEAFQTNGWKMTLGYMLQFPWGYTARNRLSELKKKGYLVTCEPGNTPSENLYRLQPPEPSGQMRWA